MLLLFVYLIFAQESSDEFKRQMNYTKQFEEFKNNWTRGMNFIFGNLHNSSKANILVCGGTGVGKTRLITAILQFLNLDPRVGKPETKDISNYTVEGIPLVLYDTPGLELDPKQQKKVTKDIIKFINSKQKTKNENDMIHCIYFCVNAESKRFQDGEIKFLKDIAGDRNLQTIPVVIVLTQSFDDELKNAMIKTILNENLNIKAIIPVLAKEKVNKQPFGIDTLLEKTTELIPEMLRETLSQIIQRSLKYKRYGSHIVVAAGTGITAGIASGLVPYTSLILSIPVHFGMCYGITKIYGVDIPLYFISAYIKWTFGYLEINNETLNELLKPKDTYNYHNNEYYANTDTNFGDYNYYSSSYDNDFNNDNQKNSDYINKLYASYAAIAMGSQYSRFEQEYAKIAKFLAQFSAEVIKEITDLVTSIITFQENPVLGVLGFLTVPATAYLCENYMGFVEEVYVKRNFKFSDITVDDIKKHLNSTYK